MPSLEIEESQSSHGKPNDKGSDAKVPRASAVKCMSMWAWVVVVGVVVGCCGWVLWLGVVVGVLWLVCCGCCGCCVVVVIVLWLLCCGCCGVVLLWLCFSTKNQP